jgi:hypothetical protein
MVPPGPSAVVLPPFKRYSLRIPRERPASDAPLLYRPEDKRFFYPKWALLDNGDVMVRQDYTGGRDAWISKTGRWYIIRADFHDFKFGALKPGPTPAPAAFAFEEYVQAENRLPPPIPDNNNIGSKNIFRDEFFLKDNAGNQWDIYTPESKAFGGNKLLVAKGRYSGGSGVERLGFGILSNGSYTHIEDSRYSPKWVNNQADVIADYIDGSRYFLIARKAYMNIKVARLQGASINGFNNRCRCCWVLRSGRIIRIML